MLTTELKANEVSWLRLVVRIWMDDPTRDELTPEEIAERFTKKFDKRVCVQAMVRAIQGDTHPDVDREPVPEWPTHETKGQRLLTDAEVAWLRRYAYRMVHVEEKKPLPMKRLAMAFYLQRFRKEGQPARPSGAPFVSGQTLKAVIMGEAYKDAPALWMCLSEWPHGSRSTYRRPRRAKRA